MGGCYAWCMKKYLVGFLALFVFVGVAPSSASALTAYETQILIAQLEAQIASLMAQIQQLNGGVNPSFCYSFSRDITFGSSSEDVTALRKALQLQGVSPLNETYFTEETASDVVRFQGIHGIRQTGYVGPLTRAKLNALYGRCSSGSTNTTVLFPPTVTSTGGKAAGSFEADAGGQLWIYGTNLVGNNLFGTKVYIGGYQATIVSGHSSELVVTVPSNLAPGYTYDMYVSNEKGTASVVRIKILSNVTTQSITILGPNGGEQFVAGSGKDVDIRVLWNSQNLSPIVGSIYLNALDGRNCLLGQPALSMGTFEINLNSGRPCSDFVRSMGGGSFKILLAADGTQGRVSDQSDGYFTILLSQSSSPVSLRVSTQYAQAGGYVSFGQTLANLQTYYFDATQSGEDVRLPSSLPLLFTSAANSQVFSSCQLFDGQTPVSQINIPPSGGGVVSFAFPESVVVARGSIKTLSLKCSISSTAGGGPFSWGLSSASTINAVGNISGANASMNVIPAIGATFQVGV